MVQGRVATLFLITEVLYFGTVHSFKFLLSFAGRRKSSLVTKRGSIRAFSCPINDFLVLDLGIRVAWNLRCGKTCDSSQNLQGIIHIQACGRLYWIISSIQIPLAVAFTAWILYRRDGLNAPSTPQDDGGEIDPCSFHKLLFPMMTLLSGVLGGFFGIGGGMLISPLLLQLGMEPEVTAATCSFVVFFSSTMSAIQYLLLGMDDLHGALTYAIVCFVASIVGLTLVQRAIKKHGRASLIVFSVATVMALSTILITGFGAMDIWRDLSSGRSMGFKPPC